MTNLDTPSPLATIFDADNHYWEASDAFTRYRDPKFLDRGLRVVEVDGALRYYVGDRKHPILPGPGDVHGRPKPGALYDYFAGKTDKATAGNELTCEVPSEHPEWFNRDARLKCMDEQAIEAVWMFPSHAVCIEGPMQPDIEASLEVLRAFNRWVEEEWGFAYQNRIFSTPVLSLSDVDVAVAELEWAASRGARVISLRNGPAFTANGMKSPADPMFDPFWARVQEMGITVAPHAGFEDGYRHVEDALARSWGFVNSQHVGDTSALTVFEPYVQMVMKHRLVRDFAAILVVQGLFERFPGLRIAYIENGGTWVGPLLHDLEVLAAQHPGMFKRSPVDQFIDCCWVAPFVEDDVQALGMHLPAERILLGSDWPHAEGVEHPRDFIEKVSSFSPADQRLIMVENARKLTFG